MHTCGVVFLGTPHRGSRASIYGKLIAICAWAFGWNSDNTLISTLELESDRLESLLQDFTAMARKSSMELICFYETLETKLTKNSLGPRELVGFHSCSF